MKIRLKESLAFIFLPRLFSRVKGLGLNFGYLAFLMALVFANARLLPFGHPYLSPQGMNTLSIRKVMGAAAHNLTGGIRNADQYITFGAFLIGTVLLMLQFAILIGILIVSTAQAASFSGFFVTPNPTYDVAFMMLDKVFQIPGMFGSVFDPTGMSGMTPFAQGLHALFAFYSVGMLMVGLLIVLYYIFAVVAETAQTGSPFGERFLSVYAPLRLVLCVTLLLPLAYGLNAGQYLTLTVARYGSSFATNAWLMYNNNLSTRGYLNPLGLETFEMVAAPKAQKISSLVNFFYLVHTCRAAYELVYGKDIQPYLIQQTVGGPSASSTMLSNFSNALSFYDNSDIVVTFGERDPQFSNLYGGLKPYCGQLTIPIDSKRITGVIDIYDVYYTFIYDLWNNSDLRSYGQKMALILRFRDKGDPSNYSTSIDWGASPTSPAGPSFYTDLRVDRQAYFNALMASAILSIRSTGNPELDMTPEILDLGWGGAGVWFNRISAFNGALTTAAFMIPTPTAYPVAMEHIMKKKRASESEVPSLERFSPSTISGGEGTSLQSYWSGSGLDNAANDTQIATLLDNVYQTINSESVTTEPHRKHDNNLLIDIFNAIFGMESLFNMRENTEVHPIARLSALGKSIIDKTIMYLGGGLIMSGLGGAAGAIDGALGATFSNLANGLMTFAMIGVAVGITFYYILPLMPFIYFFFAVGQWVKAIFEAVVAVPLWALAHLRIDGEDGGLPGAAARNGYLLLLEIFLRPVVIVFSLLGGLALFSAIVAGLDSIFTLVVSNVAGYNPFDTNGNLTFPDKSMARYAIDEFFYTIIYVALVYSIATPCFKLIDIIPQGVMRWVGSGVASFSGGADPVKAVLNLTAEAGASKTSEVMDMMSRGTSSIGGLSGDALNSALDKTKLMEKMKAPGD